MMGFETCPRGNLIKAVNVDNFDASFPPFPGFARTNVPVTSFSASSLCQQHATFLAFVESLQNHENGTSSKSHHAEPRIA